MRIVIDARMYGLEHTGIGRYTINLVSEILKIDPQNEYFILLKEPYYSSLKLPKNAQKVYSPYNHYSLDEQIRLPFQIESLNPDFVHFLHLNIPIMYSKPFIVTIHDLTILSQNKEKELLPLHKYIAKKIFFAAVANHSAHKSKYIITPSEFVKNDLVNKYKINPKKIFPIYEGLEEFSHIKSSNIKNDFENYFLYVGNAFPHKNLENLLLALKVINLRRENVRLVIVTKKNKFLDYLKNIISKLQLAKYVDIKSNISDSELISLYKNSKGFVFPSKNEGFGLPGLEALGLGTILCASDIPVFREIYKDNAIYFDPNSQESIANSLSKVLNLSEDKRKQYIKHGLKHAMSFSWEITAEKTVELYKEMASF